MCEGMRVGIKIAVSMSASTVVGIAGGQHVTFAAKNKVWS